jgi:Homeodomain
MPSLNQPIDSFAMSAQQSQQAETFSVHSTPSPSPPLSGPGQPGSTTSTPSNSTAATPSTGRQRNKTGLTMQQLNKKRQRATPDQLHILEEAFAVNPSPNAKMREIIAERIKMTERSVQIWFQNRRAKMKQMARKEGTEDGLVGGAPGVVLYGSGIGGSPVGAGMMMNSLKGGALMRSNSLGHGTGYGGLPADIKFGMRMGYNGPLTPAASPSSKTGLFCSKIPLLI